MYTIRKKYNIEYAHQLDGAYSSTCNDTIHGHSGVIELFFERTVLDKSNMVIDFGKLNDIVKPMLISRYDHSLYMPSTMSMKYLDMLKKYNKNMHICPENPTAEYFASSIYYDVEDILKLNDIRICLKKVRFHETATGWAEYSRKNVI